MKIADLKLIKPMLHRDNRGYFLETYNRKNYSKFGFDEEFVQDNQSMSLNTGTLRGLHFQLPPFPQAKLVRCINGAVFDVAVDIRRGSSTFGMWNGYELSAKNGYQLYIPVGFAHGFVTLEPNSEICYKCTNYYAPKFERAISWNDPELAIAWPNVVAPVLSDKDAVAPFFKNVESPFVFGENS